jgi:N-acetylmuramoyl-L-alanine amidase
MLLARILVALVALCWATTAAAELPRVMHEGRRYVELRRVASSLKMRLDATRSSARANLRAAGQVVTLTRDRSAVVVNGAPVALDAPVRVRQGVWLVPEAFVSRVVPALSTPAASPKLAAPRIALEDMRFRSYPSFTRVVLETSAPIRYRVERRGERETRVRFEAVGVEPRIEEVDDGLITELVLDRAGPEVVLSVRFDAVGAELKPSLLVDPPRLVLDFARPGASQPRERRDTLGPLRTIVLDAGHGGHDPGATGPNGLTEKELVLDVTKRVARLVEDGLGITVVLSRDADHFVPLRDRTSFANKRRADLFVSIHANAHRQAASEGVEIYFLSSEATDNAARQVAAAENAVVQLEKATHRGRQDVLKTILWDLAQSEFQTESSHLAETVLDSMARTLRIPNRGVKQAGFYVLGGAAMPAILVEIGFLTNPREERKLRESRYRDDIARAIYDGLAEYKRRWDQRTRTARP